MAGDQQRHRAPRMAARKVIGEDAVDAPAPGGIGQHVERPVLRCRARRDRPRALDIVGESAPQHLEHRLALGEIAGVAVAAHDLEKVGRMVVQVVHGVAVGVVVQAFAELAQARQIGSVEIELRRGALGRPREIVAVRRHHCPQALAPAQVAVHDEARAGVRRDIDECLQVGVARKVARGVVIEAAQPRPRGEQSLQVGCVGLKRDVEHRKLVAGGGVHPLEQPHVALRARHQHARARLLQPQLLQRADAIGIAVEDIVELHGPDP